MSHIIDLGRASQETRQLFYSSVQLDAQMLHPVPGGPFYRAKDLPPDEPPVEDGFAAY